MTFLRVFRGDSVTESEIRGYQVCVGTEINRFMTVLDEHTTGGGGSRRSRVAKPRRTEGIVDCSRANAWVVTRDVVTVAGRYQNVILPH